MVIRTVESKAAAPGPGRIPLQGAPARRRTHEGCRRGFRLVFGLGAAFAVAVLASGFGAGAQAQQAPRNGTEVRIQQGEGLHAGEFVVPINKSQILRLDVPFRDISVGNPGIADVLALTDRTMYILGKGLGATSLTIFGPRRQLIAVADIVVTYDIEAIKARLHELLPGERIEVRSVGDSVILGGYVSDADAVDRAVSVASRFAPGKITNMLKVRAAQQVMIHVRFAEVRRSAMKEIATSLSILQDSPDISVGSFGTAGADGVSNLILGSGATVVGSFISGALGLSIGDLTLQALFSALETKGFARTLAEPTLVALSGDTASFLAGGEFPFTTSDGDDLKTEFKEFGVSLKFTPTVLDRNRINLVVNPIVSQLDFDLASEVGQSGSGVNNTDVPPLSTRSAMTTVELGDGQSFAIAGLIQNDFDDSISQVPWLGSVPVLGALFRSTEFQRLETELVIVITPYIVKPVSGKIPLPTDRFIPPSEKDLFVMGKVREDVPNVTPQSGPGGRIVGGIAGAHGHIVE